MQTTPRLKFIVESRLWHDKVNGNTYHSVAIFDARDGLLIGSQGLTYGYGEQYRQTAYDLLIKKGLAQEEDRFNHALNSELFFWATPQWTLKKELWTTA